VTTLLLAVLLVGVAMLGMAIGTIAKGKRLRGSCGGRGAECACDGETPPRDCPRRAR
jgi:hypothetical protein